MSARSKQQATPSPYRRLSPSSSASYPLSKALPEASRLACSQASDKDKRLPRSGHHIPPASRCSALLAGPDTKPPPSVAFVLPPSPPYTNPHLRRGIPLPSLDERARTMLHREDDGELEASHRVRGYPTLLSPPYSPHRRPLMQLDEEDPLEAPASTSGRVDFADEEPSQHRDTSFEADSNTLLSDGHDTGCDVVFEDAASDPDPSGSLNLNLFGRSYAFDAEYVPLQVSPSPRILANELPELDDEHRPQDLEVEERPLFEPSDFDVFENDWDTIPSSSSLSTSPVSSSVPETIHSPSEGGLQPFELYLQESLPSTSKPPESPSRRSVHGLPCGPSEDSDLLDPLPQMLIEHGDDIDWGRRLEEQEQIPPSRHTPPSHVDEHFHDSHSPSHLPDACYHIPLITGSPSQLGPPTRSLLFTPPEPEDVPLPESPDSRLVYLTGAHSSSAAQSEEEVRIRALHAQMVATEAQAKNREVLLTEYISKLCLAMPEPPGPPPVPSPTPVPVYEPKRKDDIVVTDDGFFQYRKKESERDDDHTPPASSATVASDLPPQHHPQPVNAPIHQQSTSEVEEQNRLELIQNRTRELHTAISARANQRRVRKRVKERARELEALLQLKASQVHSDAWDAAARNAFAFSNSQSELQLQLQEEPIVLTASGSAPRLGLSDALRGESALVERHGRSPRARKEKTEKRAELMTLVAKMILRRRDSQKPLNGRSVRPGGPRIRSNLSREVLHDEEDDTSAEATQSLEREAEEEDDFDILENGPTMEGGFGAADEA